MVKGDRCDKLQYLIPRAWKKHNLFLSLMPKAGETNLNVTGREGATECGHLNHE
jgi:hypothetical protein